LLQPDQLDPAILLLAFGRRVVRHRARLAEAGGLEPAIGDGVGLDQEGLDRGGTALGERPVVGVLAVAIGVALDRDPKVGVVLQQGPDLLERRRGLGPDPVAVGGEQDPLGEMSYS